MKLIAPFKIDINPNEEGLYPVFQIIKDVAFDSDKTIIIGNDHKDSIKSIELFSKNFDNPGLLILDAHPDSEDEDDIVPYLINNNIIKKENIVIAGLRSWKKQELQFIKDNKIKNYTMKEITITGLHEVSESLMSIARNFSVLYISIDLDILDPAFVQVSAPEPGGLTTRELLTLIHRLKRLVNLKAIDIMEVYDNKELASKIALEFYWFLKVRKASLSKTFINSLGIHYIGDYVGRIKTKLTKRITFEIYRKHKDKLKEDFEENKKIITEFVTIPSKKLRNTIAGYLTRIVKAKKED